jgi:hypothetical protein
MKRRQVVALSAMFLAAAVDKRDFASAASGPSSAGAEAAVLRLLDDWAAAYVKHDRAAIDRILGEEFVMSAGRRDLQTRADYLRKVETDQEPHASITRDDERVRVYGDTVVVNHLLTLGGHLKTGHSGTGQNRPPRARRTETDGCEYSGGGAVAVGRVSRRGLW